jgi:hypothetical protein
LVWLTGWRRAVSSAASVRALLQVQRSGDCGSPRAVGSTMPSKAGAKTGIVGRQRVSSAALVANPARGQRRGLQFLNALGQRDARQAAGAADPRNAAITQFHGFAGGHQAAGVFVQMRPHASKVLGELGIGVHAQRDNTSER